MSQETKPYTNFWDNASAIGWVKYLWRDLISTPTPPSVLPSSPQIPPIPVPSTTSYSVNHMIPSKSAEYVDFLEKNFYSTSFDIQLKIPAQIMAEYLGTGAWIGVEIREKTTDRIIGCVVSKAAGYMGANSCGLIDYLCIEPTWRKKGLFYILLQTVHAYSVELDARIPQFFKKEGWFKLIPPIMLRFYMGRRISEPNRHAPAHVKIGKLDRGHWLKLIAAHQENTTNHIALTKHNMNHETELWVATYNSMHVIFKPTWEFSKGEKKGRAIVIDWYSHEPTLKIYQGNQDNNIGQDYEIIINHLPYDYIYAPTNFPHMTKIESTRWSMEGAIGLYGVMIDPGTPFRRTVLSQLTG